MSEEGNVSIVKANALRKVYKPSSVRVLNRIPDEIINNPTLKERMKSLPPNYNFEIPKTIWRIKQLEAKTVALQMPEGLLMFSITICDIIEEFTDAETIIMGDVTYGACCIDDFTATALRVDLLVHYGHSCLVPVNQMPGIKLLYIFVDINIDISHFVETVMFNFQPNISIGLVSTVQFLSSLHCACNKLQTKNYNVKIPQVKPLSPGEILGCTSPAIPGVDVLIYLGDGRFHLESAMIANPNLKAYRYDPYEKKLTEEFYDFNTMYKTRRDSIIKATEANTYGFILGTLGRQGNVNVLRTLLDKLDSVSKRGVILLLSEIFPQKLELFGDSIQSWIQIACPRLSIDWGTAFKNQLLTPYEGTVALSKTPETVKQTLQKSYPMDYYSDSSLGPWTPNYKQSDDVCCKRGRCQNKKPQNLLQ